MLQQNAQFLVTGLAVGAVYALVGLGIALVYQVTGIINFAQGEFVMAGALGFALLTEHDVALVPAALAAVALATAIGLLVERAAIAPVRRAAVERLIIITIGCSITIRGAALVFFGTSPHFAEPFSGGSPWRPVGVAVFRQYAWVWGVTAMVVLAMAYFLVRTLPGKAMRACAMNPDAARMVAISPARMSLLAFGVAAALGGVAGVILAPLQAPDYGIGLPLGLAGFTAAVIGGLESPSGAVAGGLTLGVIQSLAAGHLPSGYKDAIAFGILLLVLLVRPTGLLRRPSAVRV